MADQRVLGTDFMTDEKYSLEKFDSDVDYNTVLDNFEGPLDFLLFLINKEEIEIKDIFVSKVTDQFLYYVKNMPKLDMDKASAYLNLAATIVNIKSKSLVPPEEEEYVEEDFVDEEDDEAKLIQALEEYKLIKQETEKLKEMETVGYYYKKPDKSVGETKIVYRDFNLDGLLKAFTELMMKREGLTNSDNGIKEIPRDQFTVADKIFFIRNTVLESGKVSFVSLFDKDYTKPEIITTFQALLELLKHQYIKVKQNGIFGDIDITLNPDRKEDDTFGEIDEYN